MRTIIVGGPRTGKSTMASRLGAPVYCTDPLSKVKEPLERVTYSPDELDWGEDSDWITNHWLPQRGPWTIEGHATARVLRKYYEKCRLGIGEETAPPCDRIIVLTRQYYWNEGQRRMHEGVMTVWNGIKYHYEPGIGDLPVPVDYF
ncbi:MAG TPA: hypothetical protein VFH87_01815 [Candidatus Udaeobacter sp.]|nr:hypothetical protein [Candidatus Udaeobacter sp.]